MSKAAMKLALEALDNLMYWDNGKSDYDQARQAITALREALAEQPAQKRPQNCGTSYCSCIECVMEPAQQEPEHIVHSNGRYSPLLTRMMNKRVKSNIKQVIELYDNPYQPAQQEPAAFEEWLANQHGDPEEVGFLQALRIAYISGQDSITTPPQRTWVGLTIEEIASCCIESTTTQLSFAQELEAKLKKKNT